MSDNKNFIDCESITRHKVRYLETNNCDVETSDTYPHEYNVTYNGRTIETIVKYSTRRAIQKPCEYRGKNLTFKFY